MDNNCVPKRQVQRLVIHQPNFMPRLKVLQKINAGDLWVIFDDVQFVSREWQNRTRIRYLKRPENEFWMSIPVNRPTGQKSLLNTVTIIEPIKTKTQILKSIWHAYHASRYWKWIDNYTTSTFDTMSNSLVQLCVQSTLSCFSILGIEKATILSSILRTNGRKNTKLIEICKSVNARSYLCGSGGLSYLKENDFIKEGILIEIQNWTPPNLDDDHEDISWRNISFIDLLARYGPDLLKEHLLSWKIG